MKKIKTLKMKWLGFAVSGIFLMGFGLSLLGHSIQLKVQNDAFIYWFLWGTLALTIFFAGLSIFGEAIVYRMKYKRKIKN
jgi:uncharacterized membrane protein